MPLFRSIALAVALAIAPDGAASSSRAAEYGPELTLDDALRLASESSEVPQLAAARLARAEALRRQAVAALLPSLTLSATYTRRADEVSRDIDGDRVTVQARDALSGQAVAESTLFDLRALPLVRAARREVTAQALESAELERALAHDVAVGFFTVLGAERLLGATRQRVRVAEATLQEARLRLEAGLAGRNDETRTRLELASARLAETRAATAVDTARLSLAFVVGASIESRSLVEPADPPRADGDREALVARALAERADLTALGQRAEQAEMLARVPRYAFAPRLDGRGVFRTTNESGLSGREDDWSVSVGLTWELFDGGGRPALAAQRDAEALEARLLVTRKRREIELEIDDDLTALEAAEASVEQAVVRLEAARANASEVRERYSAGLATVLEQADAAVEQFEAEVEVVRERYSRALSRLALTRALGAPPVGAPAPRSTVSEDSRP